MIKKFKNLIVDVDGVMTDGKNALHRRWKNNESFGPDDHDALKMIKDIINIHFISADKGIRYHTKKNC